MNVFFFTYKKNKMYNFYINLFKIYEKKLPTHANNREQFFTKSFTILCNLHFKTAFIMQELTAESTPPSILLSTINVTIKSQYAYKITLRPGTMYSYLEILQRIFLISKDDC